MSDDVTCRVKIEHTNMFELEHKYYVKRQRCSAKYMIVEWIYRKHLTRTLGFRLEYCNISLIYIYIKNRVVLPIELSFSNSMFGTKGAQLYLETYLVIYRELFKQTYRIAR